MTGRLEDIVRPFETNVVTPPQTVPAAQVVSIKNTVINPGAQGSVKTMSGRYDLTITYYLDNKPTELQNQGAGSYDPYAPE